INSQSWGYSDLNARGEEIEEWQAENRLILLNKPEDKPTFFSRAWLTSTTPDLAFATDNKKCTREVADQLATSDHRPILISIDTSFPRTKRKLLQIFNASWKSGRIPNIWKKAIMIPILKHGKPRNKLDSYRPISLTSCTCKLMERVINSRLTLILESNSLLTEAQAGFRK
uniref:Endonuclease/exonuclease/phosphatase domain-containing protein n=1 Tax=Biomphalaria glabrata TaxID=6526 RepID=A0A2C9LMS3_BIOGL